jgi:DnaJ-class molecular chaperone
LEEKMSYTSGEEENCPACFGTGIQYSNKEGLRVSCPVCAGSGKRRKKRSIY